jgi:phage shock protein B
MLAVLIDHVAPLVIPIVAIVCCFAVKALRISRSYPPAQPEVTAEDRARISRITELIDKLENRVTALETLLKEEQANKVVTHEEAT